MNSNYVERNPNLLSSAIFQRTIGESEIKFPISRSFSAAERLGPDNTAGHHGSADLARKCRFF
jgi:hypothetical protein